MNRKVLLISLFLFASVFVRADYFEWLPYTITQPDGKTIHCYVTGDEFYNWIHDAEGYTIMQASDGYYYYAEENGDMLKPSGYRVNSVNPGSTGLKKWTKISRSAYEMVRNSMELYMEGEDGPVNAPQTGILNNLVVYIRFADETEFTITRGTYDNSFNLSTGTSLRSYYYEVSYNNLTISSTHYPACALTTNLSYQDSHNRSYFQPYNATTNPDGYSNDTQRTSREHQLLYDAITWINANSPVPTSLNIDGDSDGRVDNVCFIIRGNSDGWNNLLWAHRWSLTSKTVYINGVRVYGYTFQPENQVGVKTLCHEMFHALGAPDLYHYTNQGVLSPVKYWDIMESGSGHMGAYMKWKYTNHNWISSIPEITSAGTYTLNPLTSPTNNCYKIASPNSTNEFFIVEYRNKSGTFEGNLPGSGLLVYRIDTRYSGNASGPPDEVYIYRPDGTTTVNGSPNDAYFSSAVNRTAINDATNPSSFLQNGNPGGLNILNVTSPGNTISFNVSFSAPCTPPSNVQASDGIYCDKVRITWNGTPEATSYNVYKNQVLLISNLNTTQYDDPGSSSGIVQYSVSSVGTCGESSKVSDNGYRGNLELSRSFLNFTNNAGSDNSITVSSDVLWTVTENLEWLVVTPGSGSNNSPLTVTVTQNNGAARSGTITVSGCNLSRTIVVTQGSGPNLTYQSGSTSVSVSGTNVSMGLTVVNNGSSTAAASELGYYLSVDNTFATIPNYLIGTGQVGSLAAGGTSMQTFSADVSTLGIPPGTYYLAFYIDHQFQVAESDEVDNFWFFPSPQLTIPSCPSVSPNVINVPSSAGSSNFTVTSSLAWSASCDQSWCTVSPSSGTGNGTVTVNYTANTTCSSRNATITVSSTGCAPIYVMVTQEACVFSVTPTLRNVTSSAGSTSFILSTNCTWTAICDQTWCTVSPSSGAGNTTLTVSFNENTTCSTRVASITFTTGCGPVVVTVTQSANTTPVLVVSPASQSVSSSAGNTSFAISDTGCGSMSWSVTDDADWLTVTPANGTGNQTITVNYNANTGNLRTATITVTAPGATGSPKSVSLVQAGCCAPTWIPVVNQMNNMTIIARLLIDNVASINACDAVGAFAGNECRGIGYPEPALGGIIFLTPTSNLQSGEILTFKGWNSVTCEEFTIAETIPFVSQTEQGSMANPYIFHGGTCELCIDFGQGYTWFSVNVNPGSLSLNSLFSNLSPPPCENDRIIGQTAFATWYQGSWIGSLTAIDPKKMYKMSSCASKHWCINGICIPVEPVSIGCGYNWMGYLPSTDLPVNTALAGITPQPVDNDRIIGQTSFAIRYNNSWIGSLTALQKGKGYIINLTNCPATLTYPSGSGGSSTSLKSLNTVRSTVTGDKLKANSLYTMQVIGNIILPDSHTSLNPADEVYAYVGNECRGIGNITQESAGRVFLTIGSDLLSGEKITFKVYLASENRLYDYDGSLVFSNEKETGTAADPYKFDLSKHAGVPLVPDQAGFTVSEIYPNPADAMASLRIGLPQPGKVEVRIINGLGQVVKSVANSRMDAGSHLLTIDGNDLAKGFYNLVISYRNDYDNRIITRKMVIK